jgi:hypothetical protein
MRRKFEDWIQKRAAGLVDGFDTGFDKCRNFRHFRNLSTPSLHHIQIDSFRSHLECRRGTGSARLHSQKMEIDRFSWRPEHHYLQE